MLQLYGSVIQLYQYAVYLPDWFIMMQLHVSEVFLLFLYVGSGFLD